MWSKIFEAVPITICYVLKLEPVLTAIVYSHSAPSTDFAVDLIFSVPREKHLKDYYYSHRIQSDMEESVHFLGQWQYTANIAQSGVEKQFHRLRRDSDWHHLLAVDRLFVLPMNDDLMTFLLKLEKSKIVYVIDSITIYS
jgi:hypothetical protein